MDRKAQKPYKTRPKSPGTLCQDSPRKHVMGNSLASDWLKDTKSELRFAWG